MPSVKTVEDEEAIKKVTGFVVKELKAGTDKATISKKLADMGISEVNATRLVNSVHAHALKVSKEEQFTAGSIAPAIIGALVAAAAGGIIWGLIAIVTGFEIGFAAVGMGLLAGFAVVLFSKGKKGVPLQLTAVAASILGIAIGKYIIFTHVLGEILMEEFGKEVSVSVLSLSSIQLFLSNIGSLLGGFDILWVILAVLAAWKIPKGIGIKH